MDAPTVNDSSPATGAPFTLSATVRNAGDGESAATTLRFYQSTDETITTADTEAGTAAVGGLAASATSSASISLTAPSMAGTYYYGACVDAVTDESNTANNCAAGVQVTVPAPTPPPPAPAEDRAALEALYDATNGTNWSRNDNWKTDEPLGQWLGVSTASDGRVTHLDLSRNQLSGTIPAEIGSLTRLQDLSLQVNQLSGTIPAEIGNLTSLSWLELAANQLSGTIPVELGNLTRLEQLLLGFNQLSGTIPVGIGNLTRLISLDLQVNQLSGTIPAGIGNLPSLTALSLSDNQLSGTIPAELGNLTHLAYLSIDTDTGLCLAPDFDLMSPFATQTGLLVCSTEPSGTPTPGADAGTAAITIDARPEGQPAATPVASVMFEVEVNTAVPALPTPVPALPLSAAMLLGLLLL